MEVNDFQGILEKYYEYDKSNKTIRTPYGEEANVCLLPLSLIKGARYVANTTPKDDGYVLESEINEFDEDKPWFIFLGFKTLEDELKDCIENGDDYIVAIEFLVDCAKSSISIRKENIIELIKEEYDSNGKRKNKDRGILKKTVNQTKNRYCLVLIRIKEDGKEDTRFLDAYLTSSDSRVYRGLSYPASKFIYTSVDRIQSKHHKRPKNLMMFGAPGTGKSYTLNKWAEELGVLGTERFKRVTFYEEYSYERFVGGYFPVAKEGKESYVNGSVKPGSGNTHYDVDIITKEDGVSYEFRPGPFLEIIRDAWKSLLIQQSYSYSEEIEKQKNKNESITDEKEKNDAEHTVENPKDNVSGNIEEIPYLIIVEEINRANAASVFGDVFQLLDRDTNGLSEYGIAMTSEMKEWFTKDDDLLGYMETCEDNEKNVALLCSDFRLPPNLYIWSTMNGADQGVYPLDSAFKRRWSYMYRSVYSDNVAGASCKFKTILNTTDTNAVEIVWNELRGAINEKMSESSYNIEEDRFIGPHFFSKVDIEQINEYYEKVEDAKNKGTAIDLSEYPNPLIDKLYAYLRQDVFRNNPEEIFNEEYHNLYAIRRSCSEKNGWLSIDEVLCIDFSKNDVRNRIVSQQ